MAYLKPDERDELVREVNRALNEGRSLYIQKRNGRVGGFDAWWPSRLLYDARGLKMNGYRTGRLGLRRTSLNDRELRLLVEQVRAPEPPPIPGGRLGGALK